MSASRVAVVTGGARGIGRRSPVGYWPTAIASPSSMCSTPWSGRRRPGWADTFSNARWAHLDGFGRYVFRGAARSQRWADGTPCISDPRQDGSTVTVTWDRPAGGVVSTGVAITIVEAGDRLVLAVDVTGSAGSTHRAVVDLP